MMPKEFEEFLQTGVVKKVSPDKPRAEFLIEESQKSVVGLKRRTDALGIDEYSANSVIKDCYDVLIELIRAKLLLSGYNASGQHAHEAEVSYLKKLNFLESEISTLNELRHFRNSITYYGKILTVEYAKQVIEFTKKIYPKLKEALK